MLTEKMFGGRCRDDPATCRKSANLIGGESTKNYVNVSQSSLAIG
jgi:hypothetical protein